MGKGGDGEVYCFSDPDAVLLSDVLTEAWAREAHASQSSAGRYGHNQDASLATS